MRNCEGQSSNIKIPNKKLAKPDSSLYLGFAGDVGMSYNDSFGSGSMRKLDNSGFRNVNVGISALIPDTLCFPVHVIQKLLIAAQQKDILEDEVRTLNERIIEKEKQLSASNARDSSLIVSLNKEIGFLKDQKGIALGEITALNKRLKRARRTARWASVAGVITTVAAAILIK